MPIYPSSPSLVPSAVSWPGGSTSYIGDPASITYTVEVLWDDVQTTAIQFDVSTFGEGDKFSDPFFIDWTDPAIEQVSGVSSISITRGRDDNLEAFDMGSCSVTVEDNDGRYNPANASSPIYGKIRPMRHLRVYATVGATGVKSVMFDGYIRSIEHSALDGNRGISTFVCGDFFLYMSKTKPVFTNVGRDTTTGEVFNNMIAAIGVSEPGAKSVQTGDVIPSPGVGNSSTGQTALQIAGSLMEIERGDFYIAADGVITFKQRNNRALASSEFTFQNVSTRVATTSDLDRVKNKAAVVKQTDVGDFTSDWSDGPSIANFGQQDFSTISSFYIYDATQAQALAQWLVSQRKDPTTSVRSLEVVPKTFDNAGAYYILDVIDLSSKITVQESSTGLTSTTFFVESIKHSITPEIHKVNFGLVRDDALALVLDSLTSGLLDTNTLAY